jgi:hypothetical protein
MPVGLKKATPFRNGNPSPAKWRGLNPFRKSRRAERLEGIGDMRDDLGGDIQALMDKPLTNEFAGMQNAFAGLANPFANQENPFADLQAPKFQTEFENKFEDLSVNTKAAELAQQQFQQNQAAQLQSMREAGISGSQVQAMANASLQQAASTRADIGGQEASNRAMAAKGAEGVQRLEAQAKKDQAIAGFETDKLIRQGQFDVDKMIGSAQLDVDKTTMEGAWKADMAERGGAADLQNLELQRDQAGLALKAGLIEGEGAELASTKWYQRSAK